MPVIQTEDKLQASLCRVVWQLWQLGREALLVGRGIFTVDLTPGALFLPFSCLEPDWTKGEGEGNKLSP